VFQPRIYYYPQGCNSPVLRKPEEGGWSYLDVFWHSRDCCDKSRAQPSQKVVPLWVEKELQSRCNFRKESSQPTVSLTEEMVPPLPNRREEARLEVTHSCRCSGSSARSCCYAHGVGKRSAETGAQLPPHPQKRLHCLGPRSTSGPMLSFNAPGSSQTI